MSDLITVEQRGDEARPRLVGPWPQHATITEQALDRAVDGFLVMDSAEQTITIRLVNAEAEYRIVGRQPHMRAYRCELIRGRISEAVVHGD